MSGGSIVPIPKDWPNFGESNADYRKRIWAKHQSRISEKVASGESGHLLDFTKWERFYSAEVNEYYEKNKDRKQPPKPVEKAPKELKPGCGLLLLAVIVGFGLIAWYGSTGTSTSTSPKKITLMPNVMGKPFDEVNQLFETNCAEIECGYTDLVGNRSILIGANWIIADQFPRSGANLANTATICFGVRKADELENQHEYLLPDECSSSELASRKEQASAETTPWYPDGFKEHFTTGIAFRKSEKSLSCGSCRGVGYEVVSITDCPNSLYVEGNIFDASGVLIDWTNDSVGSLKAGQIAYIELTSYSGGERIEISKVSCK